VRLASLAGPGAGGRGPGAGGRGAGAWASSELASFRNWGFAALAEAGGDPAGGARNPGAGVL